MKKIRVLIIKFKNDIRHQYLPALRGAVIEAIQDKNQVLFHNHLGDKFRQSYPLIQYKRIGNKASIVCVNGGVEAVGHLLTIGTFPCTIKSEVHEMEIDQMNANQFLVQVWDSFFEYQLSKWLPLNQENYQIFQQLESVAEKSSFLEKILTGNILSFAKEMQVNMEKEVICKITKLEIPKLILYKNIKMMCFDIEFKSNVSIPDFVGLGKGTSIGYGVLAKKIQRTENIKIH